MINDLLVKLGVRDELSFLDKHVIDRFPTGSRVICNPPVLDTDEDWVVLCTDRVVFEWNVAPHGFYKTSKKYYRVASTVTTYRHETNNLNLIVTDDKDTFDRWREATEIATQENLTDKKDRIELFELITGRNKYRNRNNLSDSLVQAYRQLSDGPEPTPYRWIGTSTTGGNTVFRPTNIATYIGET